MRFANFDASALRVEISSYVLTRDSNEFIAIREDLLLRIMDIVTNSGSTFAYRRRYILPAIWRLDPEKTAAAEQQVRQWRGQHKLPFPDFAPGDKSAFRNSIAYPPPESGYPDDNHELLETQSTESDKLSTRHPTYPRNLRLLKVVLSMEKAMPHALLLSPDDQAVNAITSVLEEMSVTCQRPLDGASAAQELHSHSFDLVLVDCENLPAAKLIFDVCRRGRAGNNPVPIAIVDGHAGLPTAFRLGAELILTKPVAKDQARNTIRSAVSRVRKDLAINDGIPGRQRWVRPTMDARVMVRKGAKTANSAAKEVGLAAQLTSFDEPTANIDTTSARQSAAAASATTSLTAEMHFAPAEEKNTIKLPSARLTPPSAFFATSRTSESSPVSDSPVRSEAVSTPSTPGDTVPADKDRVEATQVKPQVPQPAKAAASRPAAAAGATTLASYQRGRKRIRLLSAVLMLTVACGGFYFAWMYQPEFRAMAQPQIDRLMVLAGMALPPVPNPPSIKPRTTTLPAAGAPTDTSQAHPAVGDQGPTSESSTDSPKGPAVTSHAALAPVVAKADVNQPYSIEKETAAAKPEATLPGESSAIIISSKGAEKRLAQSVPPQYSAEALAGQAEGTVVLKEVVDEDGKVAGVRLVEGNDKLVPAAIAAVKQWRYRPYVRDGKAQSFQTLVILDFQRP